MAHIFRGYQFNHVTEREQKSHSLKSVTIQGIHSLLQTTPYRLATLKGYELSQDEMHIAMRETVKRQDMLWDTQKRFHFIMHQSTLYSAPAGNSVQTLQLDRLERLLDAPTLRIGIVPTEAGSLVIEHGTFVIYDDSEVLEPILGGETYSLDRRRVAEYLKIFSDMEQRALYGDEARQLIRLAAGHFK